MAHEKVYAIYEDKCREETLTKAQIEEYVKGYIVGKISNNANGMATELKSLVANIKQSSTIEELRERTGDAVSEIADAFAKLTAGI